MENPEEILHSLEEFSKTRPKDIPRELEEYLCFVAKTGDPVYQWSAVKSLFREKMISVISEFYETCPSVEIPPCPNVDIFNYDVMKTFILEKLDTFAAAPFTLQRICELLTTPRKEYNRIDKYMRALEKNVLVVSTTEPGGRRSTENGESIMNGLESEHLPETSNSSNDINVEEMDDTPSWPRMLQTEPVFQNSDSSDSNTETLQPQTVLQEASVSPSKLTEAVCSSSQDTVITCRNSEEPYVSIEPVPTNTCTREDADESDVSVTITAIPAGVQKRRSSVEPVVSSDSTDETVEACASDSTTTTTSTTTAAVSSENAVNEELIPATESVVTETKEDESSSSSSSTSDENKDADSSSNPEELLPDNSEKIDAIVPTITPENEPTESIYTTAATTESTDELTKTINEVDTSSAIEEPQQQATESVLDSMQPTDNECSTEEDTAKCSIQAQQPEESPENNALDEISEEPEITTSTDNVANEVESSDSNSHEAEAKVVSPSKESSEISAEIVENVAAKEESSSNDSTPTPMDVDEENSSEKSEEIVKAEATSDSSL